MPRLPTSARRVRAAETAPRERRRREPIIYVVESEPVEPDPKVAAEVLRWLRDRMG